MCRLGETFKTSNPFGYFARLGRSLAGIMVLMTNVWLDRRVEKAWPEGLQAALEGLVWEFGSQPAARRALLEAVPWPPPGRERLLALDRARAAWPFVRRPLRSLGQALRQTREALAAAGQGAAAEHLAGWTAGILSAERA